jgi:hypothetical protein
VGIHEAVILRLVVGRAARGDRFGDETIYLLTALATETKQNLDGLARVANGFWHEVSEPRVRKQHDRNRVADDDARASVSAQIVGRVTRLSGNVCQPNHVLADQIAAHKTEPRP